MIANRYELRHAIGSGGFATVYRALDLVDNREVALKLIPEAAAEVTERFRLEALALSRLRSPHVARVYDFGKDDEKGLYLVMELIDGVALEATKLGRVLLAHEVMRAARALLSGLAEAHAARIVHRDIKPANVVVPNGIAGLGELKVLDFGIAQSEHRALLEADYPVDSRDPRRALGTPAYMAPELLMGEASSPASDVYSAGLVLFELLGHSLLFPDRPARDQLKVRTEMDPALAVRVPAPLDAILGRMLARDPSRRFKDAGEALSELVNMETAPVEIADFVPPPPPAPVSQPGRRRSIPPAPYVRPTLGTMRMSRLDEDAVAALRATLHALDLPMLEALARRERGSEIGRVARALSLGLRLEIDAAALVLEPLAERTDVARAVAACVLAPRARVATKARIEKSIGASDWIDDVDVEIGELLVAIEAAICGPEEITRCITRCERLLARDHSKTAARHTVELVKIALTARSRGATDEGLRAYDALAVDSQPLSPLLTITRALLLGPLAFRIDDHAARASFERASQLASDAGATLLEVRALVSWGGMLIEVPGRLQQGLTVLERVTTLLLHADVPSLEHLAAHNRGAAFIVEGRWAQAAEQFHRAREVAAKGEAPLEFEILSGAQELTARLAAGDRENARAVAKLLDLSRNVPVAPREALLVNIACSLAKLFEGDLEGARRDLAVARKSSGAAGDALLLAGALDVIYAAGAGEPVDYLATAAELHRTAEEHGFAAFYWFDAIRAIASHLEDFALRTKASHAVERLIVLLAPSKKG